ncbi:uncharacterized protein LOC120086363 [Benincasa hispida]|uniref:uncharacterized protein LOC120086363 n=1 Tax=Benincasa hispida TaxID=102211 RepID=UPI0019025454|nr:uncharacterized protein LOC120086363 [Benincasa hispida]
MSSPSIRLAPQVAICHSAFRQLHCQVYSHRSNGFHVVVHLLSLELCRDSRHVVPSPSSAQRCRMPSASSTTSFTCRNSSKFAFWEVDLELLEEIRDCQWC